MSYISFRSETISPVTLREVADVASFDEDDLQLTERTELVFDYLEATHTYVPVAALPATPEAAAAVLESGYGQVTAVLAREAQLSAEVAAAIAHSDESEWLQRYPAGERTWHVCGCPETPGPLGALKARVSYALVDRLEAEAARRNEALREAKDEAAGLFATDQTWQSVWDWGACSPRGVAAVERAKAACRERDIAEWLRDPATPAAQRAEGALSHAAETASLREYVEMTTFPPEWRDCIVNRGGERRSGHTACEIDEWARFVALRHVLTNAAKRAVSVMRIETYDNGTCARVHVPFAAQVWTYDFAVV